MLALAGLLLVGPGCRRTNTPGGGSTTASQDTRPLPPGFPRQHLAELMAIADEAAKHCERLFEARDCYCHNCSQESGGPSGDPKKVVPLPAGPLGRDKRLRLLHARCSKDEAPVQFCDSGSLDYPADVPKECGTLDPVPGWPPLGDGFGEELLTTSGCPGQWMEFVARRKLSEHRTLDLLAFFRL